MTIYQNNLSSLKTTFHKHSKLKNWFVFVTTKVPFIKFNKTSNSVILVKKNNNISNNLFYSKRKLLIKKIQNSLLIASANEQALFEFLYDLNNQCQNQLVFKNALKNDKN